jgi:hypothetical protein
MVRLQNEGVTTSIPFLHQNSTDLLTDLKNITVPPDAKSFSANATSMYTSIDTATSLQALNNIFTTYAEATQPHFLKIFL